MVNEQKGIVQFPKTSEHLFEMANELGFYSNLIAQLNKDFLLANIDEVFDNNISPNCLMEKVQNIVFELLNSDYDSYLKLLYIIVILITNFLIISSLLSISFFFFSK